MPSFLRMTSSARNAACALDKGREYLLRGEKGMQMLRRYNSKAFLAGSFRESVIGGYHGGTESGKAKEYRQLKTVERAEVVLYDE